MKKNYALAILLFATALCSAMRSNAQAYWTQQYNSLPILYDVTDIIGYGPNMILGGTPYYTHTVSTAFMASPSVHKIYHFARAYGMLFGVSDSAIYKSSDDGVTWDSTALSYPLYGVSADARLSVDGNTLYVWDPNNITNFGNDVLKTTDTGKTWSSSGYQQPDGYGFAVHNGVAYASSLNGLQYSTDNGANWYYVTTIGSTVNDVVVFNDTVYVATNMGVYKGTGNPQQWTATIQYNTLSLCNAGTTLLCGTMENGVWQSDPTGIYWFSKSDDLPYTGTGVLKPVTTVSFNDFYAIANVRFDTTGVVHYVYTMPIIALQAASLSALSDVQVYPNPARGQVFINTGKALNKDLQVSLLDMQGRLLMNHKYSNSDIITLDLGNIPAGMYVINMNDGHSSISRKIRVDN